jgi:hypothetical protein
MEATVDIRDRSGPVLATAARTAPAYTTPVFDTDQHDADQLIDRIVRTNTTGAPISTQHLAGRKPAAGFQPTSFTVPATR